MHTDDSSLMPNDFFKNSLKAFISSKPSKALDDIAKDLSISSKSKVSEYRSGKRTPSIDQGVKSLQQMQIPEDKIEWYILERKLKENNELSKFESLIAQRKGVKKLKEKAESILLDNFETFKAFWAISAKENGMSKDEILKQYGGSVLEDLDDLITTGLVYTKDNVYTCDSHYLEFSPASILKLFNTLSGEEVKRKARKKSRANAHMMWWHIESDDLPEVRKFAMEKQKEVEDFISKKIESSEQKPFSKKKDLVFSGSILTAFRSLLFLAVLITTCLNANTGFSFGGDGGGGGGGGTGPDTPDGPRFRSLAMPIIIGKKHGLEVDKKTKKPATRSIPAQKSTKHASSKTLLETLKHFF